MLEQLRSMGFNVLYFPYNSLVAAFQSEGIDIAFKENTPHRIFQQTTDRIEKTSAAAMTRIRTSLVREDENDLDLSENA
jgi:hypothetical protein